MADWMREIDRVYEEKGASVGYARNWNNIHGWAKQRLISYEQEKELLRYNRVREIEESYKGNW